MRFAHISDVLRNHKTTQSLVDSCKRDSEAEALVRGKMPEMMRCHCQDISVSDNRLTVVLDSPVWVTRARFIADELLAVMGVWGIRDVRFLALPKQQATLAPRGQGASARHRLTKGVVTHLLEAADHLDDPELSSAFRRFALRHAGKPEGGDA